MHRGVCSNYLCDLKVGDTIQMTGPSGTAMVRGLINRCSAGWVAAASLESVAHLAPQAADAAGCCENAASTPAGLASAHACGAT